MSISNFDTGSNSDERTPTSGEAGDATTDEQRLFQETRIALREEPRAGRDRRVMWLSLTLILFAVSLVIWFDVATLALLVGVLLLHESGHYVGMRIFGYRDVRMFFIPFFGAAVVGRKHAAPVWQQGIVLMLGPLPGIALAGILFALWGPQSGTRLQQAMVILIYVNAFNLLPFVPLDGGRLLYLLIFSRHRWLEVGFLLFAAAGIGGIAWWWGSWILGLLAAAGLIAVPIQYKRTGLRAMLRRETPEMPDQLDDLTEQQQRKLFLAACESLPSGANPRQLATAIRALHGEVVQRPASFVVVAGLLLLYTAGAVGGPWLHAQITWTWGREPPWHAQFSEMQGESGQLEKDADELKREARVLLDQAVDNPVDAARLRSEAKARLEQAVEKLEEAIRLTERADRHIRRQMPTVDAEEWISQLLPDPEHLARERNSLKGEIEAADR